MRAREPFAGSVLAASLLAAQAAMAQPLDDRRIAELERALQQEGETVVALADGPGRADFPLAWHHDLFKAQSGVFVPFIAGITQPEPPLASVLLYLRVVPEADPASPARGAAAFEEIYPVEVAGPAGGLTRLARGFAVPPGDYDVTLVARERDREAAAGRPPRASILRAPLSVPDFTLAGLTTSTVIVGDRLTPLAAPADPLERPYVIAGREIQPAADRTFAPDDELVVAFLVYNPAVTPDEHFDIEVEYHFLRQDGGGRQGADPDLPAARPGETYVNHTEPQRFTPHVLGPGVGPAAGQPILAGQGVPLSGFDQGDYRLVIRVTDLVSGRVIDREITFTVQR